MTLNYAQYLAMATMGLPDHIDYKQYLGEPNYANQYLESDALRARAMCKTIARLLLVP
jgi:hypothetical protein